MEASRSFHNFNEGTHAGQILSYFLDNPDLCLTCEQITDQVFPSGNVPIWSVRPRVTLLEKKGYLKRLPEKVMGRYGIKINAYHLR